MSERHKIKARTCEHCRQTHELTAAEIKRHAEECAKELKRDEEKRP